ncbi:MAG: GGDEF domain-containing protein [Butyrivibrio sp.]|nr:GGDEF domain-containing protein [Butyrivibrio sp.]
MKKVQKRLLLKFGILFSIFIVVTLLVSGVMTYLNQMDLYQKEQEEGIRQIATYLEKVIQADGEEFLWYQEYFLAHTKDLRIPHDFGPEERDEAATAYQKLFAETYPGKVLGEDVDFHEMPDELQRAYTIYNHMYYLLLFEQARDDFDVEYTYYITPFGDEPYTMCYVIDAVREELWEDGECYILITDEIYQDPKRFTKMWEAWETGMRPVGFDVFNNEFGHGYAYATPLFIGEEKVGVICVDLELARLNQGILSQTLRQIGLMAAVLLITVSLLLCIINRRYISKIEHLSEHVRNYAQHKDPNIVAEIEHEGTGNDELAALSNQTAAMILELDNYMQSLIVTTRELTDTRERAEAMNELAHKDALTGIRNKTAYDKEIQRLEWDLQEGETEFGIAMIDLNFLKRINDTYGHERGNIAIKRLCEMVCHTFEHSPVFRIGGDEFVVILRGQDYQHIRSLVAAFNEQMDAMEGDAAKEPWEKISAAIGYALYDLTRDEGVDNVFKRADKAMYARKMEMKAVRQQ